MPTLDFQVGMNSEGRLSYKFYKKPMSNKFCVMANAAISEDTKLAVLEEESPQTRNKILDEFQEMLRISDPTRNDNSQQRD